MAQERETTKVSIMEQGPGTVPEQQPQPAPSVPQAPAPPGGQPLPPMPKNELMAALSSGFAKAAVGHFGRAIGELLDDPTVVGYYDEIGSDVKQALHDRWNQREFETYYKQYVEPMNQKLTQVVELRKNLFNALGEGKVIDPATGEVIKEIDPNGVEAMNLRVNYERDGMAEFQKVTGAMMDSAQKFAHNPMVNEMMANMLTQQSQAINGIIKPINDQLGPQQMSEIELNKANAARARSTKRQIDVQTGLMKEDDKGIATQPLEKLVRERGTTIIGQMLTTLPGKQRLDIDAAQIAEQRTLEWAAEKGLNPAVETDLQAMKIHKEAIMPGIRIDVLERQARVSGVNNPGFYEEINFRREAVEKRAKAEDLEVKKITTNLNDAQFQQVLYGNEEGPGITSALESEAAAWASQQPGTVSPEDIWHQMIRVILPDLLARKFSNDPGAMKVRRRISETLESKYGKRGYKEIKTNPIFRGLANVPKEGIVSQIFGAPTRRPEGLGTTKVRPSGTGAVRAGGRASRMTGR